MSIGRELVRGRGAPEKMRIQMRIQRRKSGGFTPPWKADGSP